LNAKKKSEIIGTFITKLEMYWISMRALKQIPGKNGKRFETRYYWVSRCYYSRVSTILPAFFTTLFLNEALKKRADENREKRVRGNKPEHESYCSPRI